MDLPTCPACGQSVLDDDAQDCPFCGAAMDGSSPAKKPAAPAAGGAAAAKSGSRPAAKAAPENDDPFAIAQQPTGQKVLQCAPRPMKGRLTKVACPMCETPGFIPKAALGRQVRCANRECLVPVFTAAAPDAADAAPKAPSRASSEESRPRPKAAPSDKKPYVLYGIIGAVLLVGTGVLIAVLNKPAPTELGAADLSKFNFNDSGTEPEDTEATTAAETKVPEVVDYQAQAVALVEDMIQTARINAGNRDKAFCRRLTGDAFLRLGLDERASTEFAQMAVVASNAGIDTAYYQISPLLSEYWKHLRAGDQAAADQKFSAAKALADQIPKRGAIAVESTIAMAAAMVAAGDAAGAVALVEGQQRDATVVSQLDAIRHGVWSATGQALRNAGAHALSPLQVFSWNEPLKTGVGIQLCAEQQWQPAVNWAAALTDPATSSDTFAAIAGQMVRAAAPVEQRQALLAAAKTSGDAIGMRTQAILAQNPASTQDWEQTLTAVQSVGKAQPAALPGIDAVINDSAPTLETARITAAALTDAVIAAIKHSDSAAASGLLQQVYGVLSAEIPPTVILRQASRELDQRENEVKARVAKALNLVDDNRIRSQFLAYRRNVDRLAGLAEQRRLILIGMLSRIIHHGGLDVVKTTVASTDSGLRQEVVLDDLKNLLFVAAAMVNQPFPEILETDSGLAVPVARIDPLPEAGVMKVLVEAWKQYQATSSSAAAANLEAVNDLPGLRASMAAFMTELSSLKATSPQAQLNAIAALKDDLWREECLPIATRILTRSSDVEELQAQLAEATKTPTQRQVALYGMVRGLLDTQDAKAAK